LAKRLFFITLIFLSFGAFQIAFGETEFWSVNAVQFPLREKVKLNLIPELRFRSGELYYSQTYFGPALLLSKNFEIDIYYALNYSKGSDGWEAKSLGYLDTIYGNEIPWFYFKDRTRFEYDISSDTLKIRNFYQFKKGNWFVGDELFYNFKKGFNDEGRACAGYSFKMANNLELSISYILRRQRQKPTDDWTRTNVISAGMKVNL